MNPQTRLICNLRGQFWDIFLTLLPPSICHFCNSFSVSRSKKRMSLVCGFIALSCCFLSFLSLFWQKKRPVSSWKRFFKNSKKRYSIGISDGFWIKNGQKISEIFTLVRGFLTNENPLTSLNISSIFWSFLTQKSSEILIVWRFFEFFKNRFHEDAERFFCQKSAKNEKKQQERPRKYRKGRITVGWFLL